MANITYSEKIENVTIGNLFDEMGFDNFSVEEKENIWPVEVLSFDGFYQIEAMRTVEKQKTIRVDTKQYSSIEGAYDHIVLTKDRGWQKLEDLAFTDCLVSHNSMPEIKSITFMSDEKLLYDFQVQTAHSFMTNGILSHNSHWLVSLGANAMKAQKNVLHYTFELSETDVGLRYDSNLCNIPSNDVQDNKDAVKDFYEKNQMGRLIIKEYPTGSASVITIRNHIEKLSLKGFKPHLIIIDYADIMKSTRAYDSLRYELKLIYEELRNLSMELGIPVWTASQANRDSSNSDVVGLENMSESYGKAMVADVVVSISRKATEKATGLGRLFIAKNRAGRDGIVFPISIDTSMSKFDILNENALTLDEEISNTGNQSKKMLLDAWKSVKNDQK